MKAKFDANHRHYTLSFGLSVLATAVWQRGYLWPLDSLPFATGVKGQDIGQMVWNLWHTAEALAHGRNPYFASEIFAPVGAPLAQHTLATGFAPVTLLVKLLSGSAPLYPLYAYHIVVGLCFTLLLFFSYNLLREIGATRTAATLAAWGYAFSDFYTWHTMHLNHLAGWVIPLMAWGLVRCWQHPTRRRLVWPVLTASLAVYFTELTAYLWLAIALCALGLAARTTTRMQLFVSLRTLGGVAISLALAFASLLVTPFVGQLIGLRVIKPQPFEAGLFSANLAALFVPLSEQSPVYAPLLGTLSDTITAGYGEPGAFLGWPVLLLALLGLACARRHVETAMRQMIYLMALLASVFLLLSLGPRLQIFGTDTGLLMPYAVLAYIPPFDLSRTPVRLVALVGFFLMLLAAIGADFLLTVVKQRFGARAKYLASAVLAVWLLAESYVPAPTTQKFTPPDLSQMAVGPVLNLPLYRTDGYAVLLQTQHHQPIATGYLARNTETTWAHYVALANLLQRGGTDFCQGVQQFGYQNVIIAPETTYVGETGNFAALDLPSCTALKVLDLRDKPDIDRRPAQFPALRAGQRVNLGRVEATPFLWYGWSDAETDFRWTKGTQAALVFAWDDAGASASTVRLTFSTGAFLAPQVLTQQRVTPLLNGVALPVLELKSDAAQVYEITLPRNALRRENILRFNLPDAAAPAALHLGTDERLLGLRVEWFEIAK